MSDAQTTDQGSDLDIYGLTEAELARVLLDAGLSPEHGSPLAGRPADPGDTDPGLAEALPSGVRAGLERVARPDRVVAMVTGTPPGPAEPLWFYGRRDDLDFAYYADGAHVADGAHFADGEGGRHHLAWPVDGVTMLDLATAPLSLTEGAEPTALSLALGPEEFSALCVLADFLRQETLRGLLTPVPHPQSLPRFTLADLDALAARVDSFHDLGWTVPRAGVMAPVELDFGRETVGVGLESLRESGLLVEEDGQHRFSVLLHRLCLQLGLCQGFTAVSSWNKDPESQAWELEHFALSRSPGTLLLLEFQEVTESSFLVALDDVTPELAFHWLRGILPVPVAGPWSELEELPEGEGAAEVEGLPVAEGAPEVPAYQTPSGPRRAPGPKGRPRSTAGGADAAPTGADSPPTGADSPPTGADPAPVPRFCTRCGTSLDPEKRFCTACGTPVKEIGQGDQRP